MSKKNELGQYMTTNYEYIFQNMYIPKDIKSIIEPFAGNGDLLNFFDNTKYDLKCYDIDPKKKFIKKRDTLENPPDYKNTFVITNPPYLARNKTKQKKIFDKYNVNDLYKCFIKNLISDVALGGIIIVPLNFWSSIRKSDIELRKQFLEKYNILLINIFEEQVFVDTSYTVCCFQFEKKTKKSNDINITIYPTKTKIKTNLNDENNYIIGGEIYNLQHHNHYKIGRLTKKNKQNTNILVKCIDDNNENKIKMSIVTDEDIYIDNTKNQTARTYASLVIEPKITLKKQKILVDKFNVFLDNFRTKYNSLFLTNYRESKDIARKRISFDLVYKITNHILDES